MPHDRSRITVVKGRDGKLGVLRTNLGEAFLVSATEALDTLLAAIDDADDNVRVRPVADIS